MKLQADGKMLFSGFDFGFAASYLVRYNTNGTLDTTFDDDGQSRFLNGQDFIYWGLVPLPDGKILTSGVVFRPNNEGDFAVFRYTSDGKRDLTWGMGGAITISLGGYDEGYQMLVQPDGKIVVFGATQRGTSDIYDIGVARLNVNGTLDTSFGTDGKLIFQLPNLANLPLVRSVALQPDGKIIMFGADAPDTLLIGKVFLSRINPNGTLDNTFGTNGIVFPSLPPVFNQIRNMRLQPDGKIIFPFRNIDEGGFPVSSGAVRLNPNGTPDASFGTNGSISIPAAQGLVGRALVLQPNGKIVLGGGITSGDKTEFALRRFNSNGTIDTTFGTNGVITTAFENAAFISEMELQTDGKLVALGGLIPPSGIYDVAAARYLLDTPAPSPFFDFDGDARADISVFRPDNGVWYRLSSADNSFAAAQWGVATDKIVPADYDGDRKSDLAVFRNGVWYILQSSNNAFRQIQFGIAGDVPVSGDYDGDGKADLAVFRGGTWYVLNSADNSFRSEQFGLATDKPIAADFDGDFKQDLAVYRNGTWYAKRSTQGFYAAQFGLAADKPVAADYDGDGRTDLAVYRNGAWYLLNSNAGFSVIQFGLASDKAVPADYDGDGKADVAVYRDGNWFILNSSNNVIRTVQFGLPSDLPVQTAYLP